MRYLKAWYLYPLKASNTHSFSTASHRKAADSKTTSRRSDILLSVHPYTLNNHPTHTNIHKHEHSHTHWTIQVSDKMPFEVISKFLLTAIKALKYISIVHANTSLRHKCKPSGKAFSQSWGVPTLAALSWASHCTWIAHTCCSLPHVSFPLIPFISTGTPTQPIFFFFQSLNRF